MAKLFECKCGEKFKTRRHPIEHVGLQNPHWPRTSPNDAHGDKAANHPSIKE